MTVDDVLRDARSGLPRHAPREAASAAAEGALLVDIRPQAQREREGEVPGALVVERNVLEWRLDPASPWRLPEVRDHGQRVVVLCSEGYASSLAASSLQRLGLVHASDVEGGFQAWAAAGLPVRGPAAAAQNAASSRTAAASPDGLGITASSSGAL